MKSVSKSVLTSRIEMIIAIGFRSQLFSFHISVLPRIWLLQAGVCFLIKLTASVTRGDADTWHPGPEILLLSQDVFQASEYMVIYMNFITR